MTKVRRGIPTRRGAPAPLPFPRELARRLWLHRLGLDRDSPFGSGADGALATLRRLGYAQIDTVYVVERAHHHILWSRDPSYRPADLHRLQAERKEVFEYWTHALAFVPVEDFRYFVRAMRARERDPSGWFAGVTKAQTRALLRRIATEGPISIRQIEEAKQEKDHPWASRKPSKRALEYLFYSGRLAICRREGMTKHYDLLERHFGWEKRPAPASPREEAAYRLDRALRTQGVVTLESATYLERDLVAQIRAEIARRSRDGSLLRVSVGDAAPEAFATPAALADAARLAPVDPRRISILSPFDPLVIQRKRLRAFFDFDYTVELYLPAEKRRYGYFCLPILAGEEMVARIDLKAERERGELRVQSWHWEKNARDKRVLRAAIEARLEEFSAFQFAR